MNNLQPGTCPLPRSLPRNISAHKGGYNVRVGRAGVVYRAWVRDGSAVGLARALTLRDRFLRIHGEVNRHRVRGHSNTGLAGISETTKWKRNNSYPGFTVDWCERGRHRNRHFRYGPHCPRATALQHAITFRARVANLNLSTFTL